MNARAAIDAEGFEGHTPLFHTVVNLASAMGLEDDSKARLLLDHGADPRPGDLPAGGQFHGSAPTEPIHDVTPIGYAPRHPDQRLVNARASRRSSSAGEWSDPGERLARPFGSSHLFSVASDPGAARVSACFANSAMARISYQSGPGSTKDRYRFLDRKECCLMRKTVSRPGVYGVTGMLLAFATGTFEPEAQATIAILTYGATVNGGSFVSSPSEPGGVTACAGPPELLRWWRL